MHLAELRGCDEYRGLVEKTMEFLIDMNLTETVIWLSELIVRMALSLATLVRILVGMLV